MVLMVLLVASVALYLIHKKLKLVNLDTFIGPVTTSVSDFYMESQCNACSKIFEKTDDCPYHQFVMTTHDKGRLGNKMSEYATLLAVSALTGFTPVLSKEHHSALIDVFPSIPYNGSIISDSCINEAHQLFTENLAATQAFLATRPQERIRNIRLMHYPNTVFYFDKIKGILKDHFAFTPRVNDAAEEFLAATRRQIASRIPNPIWVGIHVRRTDYEHHLDMLQNGTLVKFEFFIRAMIKLKETLSDSNPNFDPSNLVYLVSSDDVDWIKDNFQTLAHAETIIYAANAFESKFEFPPNHLDMCIMSKCNHSIVDYGTFGFWGAYLAGGHTIQAENIGTGFSIQVESIKQAKLSKWQFIEAHSRQTP
ncbi:hypothetical protein TCAL_09571 [Tigriopus californicus]|uniref:L-Fucosyltransferase n=2 Tax=Tigriopus californicus TaxID=6832 RepID=A0A553PS14_TIGCA|nr:hypothetical protein TCAL_09571 [Tigriopus californicus]